jgi:sulfate/thiosulfate transport system ATP-binding protein
LFWPVVPDWQAIVPNSRRFSEDGASMSVKVEGVSRRFGSQLAIEDVSFEVPSGELVALLGPSGSGKSTLLRIIAGLERPDAGRVTLSGKESTDLPARDRGIGFVFQHYALFRHMTVRQNIAFGLEVRKQPRAQVRARGDELLELVRLPGFADRYPSQLSGGQRQRVALARALAPRPGVLLLDEPFGALDAKVREELRTWLRNLHDEVRVTTLIVTHDQQEAFGLSDQVIVMNHGRVEQMGHPQVLYEQPATPFVTEFLGGVNVLRGRVEGGRTVLGEGVYFENGNPGADGPVSVYVRHHDMDVSRERMGDPCWPATVTRLTPLGALQRLEILLHEGTRLGVELTRERSQGLALAPGDSVFVSPRASKIFHAEAGILAGGLEAFAVLRTR